MLELCFGFALSMLCLSLPSAYVPSTSICVPSAFHPHSVRISSAFCLRSVCVCVPSAFVFCVPSAFLLRSVCIPSAFLLRSICVLSAFCLLFIGSAFRLCPICVQSMFRLRCVYVLSTFLLYSFYVPVIFSLFFVHFMYMFHLFIFCLCLVFWTVSRCLGGPLTIPPSEEKDCQGPTFEDNFQGKTFAPPQLQNQPPADLRAPSHTTPEATSFYLHNIFYATCVL